MEINKTTVYTLTKSDIQEVCYSLFVQKLKALGINAYFEVGDVKLLECDGLLVEHLSAKLKTTKKCNIMKIEINSRHGFTDLNVIADNVNANYSISETLYALDKDGKKDYKQRLGEDITDEGLSILVNPLENLIYYRSRDFDSSELIERLFEKLSEEKRQVVLKTLNEDYGDI